jgi:hypothetical protein
MRGSRGMDQDSVYEEEKEDRKYYVIATISYVILSVR